MGKTQELPALCCSDMRAPSYPYCPRSQLLKGSNLCVGLSSLHRRSSYQHWHGPGSLGTARMLCYAPSPSAMCLIQHLKWQCCFSFRKERANSACAQHMGDVVTWFLWIFTVISIFFLIQQKQQMDSLNPRTQ